MHVLANNLLQICYFHFILNESNWNKNVKPNYPGTYDSDTKQQNKKYQILLKIIKIFPAFLFNTLSNPVKHFPFDFHLSASVQHFVEYSI